MVAIRQRDERMRMRYHRLCSLFRTRNIVAMRDVNKRKGMDECEWS